MKYKEVKEVLPTVAGKSMAEIEAVNSYVDSLKGVVVTIQHIRSGQQGRGQDSAWESLIFCHQPNVLTTNAPLVRSITQDEALALVRIFVRDYEEKGKGNGWGPVLQWITPEPNPCGLREPAALAGVSRHSCWRVLITQVYSD